MDPRLGNFIKNFNLKLKVLPIVCYYDCDLKPNDYIYRLTPKDIYFFYKLLTLTEDSDLSFLNTNFKLFEELDLPGRKLIRAGSNFLDIFLISPIIDIIFDTSPYQRPHKSITFTRDTIIKIIENSKLVDAIKNYAVTDEMDEKFIKRMMVDIIKNLNVKNLARVCMILKKRIDQPLMTRLHSLTSLDKMLIDQTNENVFDKIFPLVNISMFSFEKKRLYYDFYKKYMGNRFGLQSLRYNLSGNSNQIIIRDFLFYIKEGILQPVPTPEPILQPVPTPEPILEHVYNPSSSDVEMQNNKIIQLIEELTDIKKYLCKLYEIDKQKSINCNKTPFLSIKDNILEHFHAPELEKIKSEIYRLLESEIIKNNYQFFDNPQEFRWSNEITSTERLELWKNLLALKTNFNLFANQFVNNKIMESFNELMKINEDLCDSYCAKREKNRFFHTKKRCIANNCLGIRSFLQAVKEYEESKTQVKNVVDKKINKILSELISDKNDNKLYLNSLDNLNSLDIDKKIELWEDLTELINDFLFYYSLDATKYVSIVKAYKTKKYGGRKYKSHKRIYNRKITRNRIFRHDR